MFAISLITECGRDLKLISQKLKMDPNIAINWLK